jgi:NADH pyrophosphatase NudC (nudix superfamily)
MTIAEKNRDVFRHCPQCGRVAMRPEHGKALRCTACQFVLFFNAAAAVAGLILDGARLLVTVRAGEPHPGMLDLPGGFVDPGERAEQALRREVREELSLEVTDTEYLGSSVNEYLYGGVTYPTTDLAFRCAVAPGAEPVADDDVADWQWLAPDEVRLDRFCSDSMREFVDQYFLQAPAGPPGPAARNDD